MLIWVLGPWWCGVCVGGGGGSDGGGVYENIIWNMIMGLKTFQTVELGGCSPSAMMWEMWHIALVREKCRRAIRNRRTWSY